MATTPQNVIELELLLQSYYKADMLITPSYVSVEHHAALNRLLKAGLVELHDDTAKVTERGRFYVHHLLQQPYPEVAYRIPT